MYGKKQGNTKITYPKTGRAVPFSDLVAGDFFLSEGSLFLKINLKEAKKIDQGYNPSYGLHEFGDSKVVYCVDVVINILQ